MQAMDLVDKQHIALFEICEDRSEVARLFDDRAGSGFQRRTHLIRNDIRQRSFSDARRAREQDMIESLAPFQCRLHKNAQVVLDLLLSDVFGQLRRSKRRLEF